METLTYTTHINAPRQKVWQTLWDDASYRQWTVPFAEGCYAVTDNWKEGTKVLFLASNGDGMVSQVAANKPNEFMSFRHQGEIKDGVEDTTSEKVKQWQGSKENYTLTDKDGGTELVIDMDIAEAYKDYFNDTWPKALAQVKKLSESK